MSISYKQIFPKIDTFIFDVDGVLTNGLITIFPDGELVRQINAKDSFALQFAVKQGYKVFVISRGKSEGVKERLEEFGIGEVHMQIFNKGQKYDEIVQKHALNPENILYMGDDLPDLEVLAKVGMPCCPNDAVREVQESALYISDKKGGEGAVRDVIEQVLRVQGKWSNFK